MASSLHETLLAAENHDQVVTDCMALINQELAEKSGVSGNAVKLAYKTANAFAPGYLREVVAGLLPEIGAQLEPYWVDFGASGSAEFGDYLAKRGEQVAESLLTMTDRLAADSERPTIVKAYRAVRGGAARHVEAALPRVGTLAQKYAG
ncbi:MAG TPA: hypothetical protein VGI58_15460 [Streptosporangiaceae bacterium]|jgi:hypothetical protein